MESFHFVRDTSTCFLLCFDALEWHNFVTSRQSADRAVIEIAPWQGSTHNRKQVYIS